MPKNADIEVLKEQVRIIRDNELKHLAEDVKRVDNKVDKLAEQFEGRFEAMEVKIAKYSGGIAVIIVLADWLIKIITGK